MKVSPFFLGLVLLSPLGVRGAEPVRPPILHDTALRVELFDGFPSIETPTTVAAGPDGSVFIGSDPRDGRLNTRNPECQIARYSDLKGTGKTVFAKGLYSPAGMVWHDGWLYVIHDPLLSRFKDTNGDGIADVREDLVTSLGLEPYDGLNDHVVSGFTLGMDGYFYISCGDRGVYRAKGKDGSELTLQGGGIIRCRPDGTHLEVFSGGTRNHLEVDLDAMDHAFTLDNTDDGNGWWTRLTHHIEGGYYGYPFYFKHDTTNGLKLPGPQKPQAVADALAPNEKFLPAMIDFGGGSPTGGLCYLSDGLPEKYRGKLLFAEWGQRKLAVIEVIPDGATYKFVRSEALLEEEKGGSFRPMEIYVAADGSLLISDWGYGGWKSPKQAGAVWHLSWPEATPLPRLPDAEKAAIPELIAALDHPDRDQRLRAEWALIHRGEEAIPSLINLLHNTKASEVQRAHALWAVDLIGDRSAELRSQASGLIRQLLSSESNALRAQAIRALAGRAVTDSAGEIATGLTAQNAEVRLQSAIALGRLHAHGAASNLIKTLSDEDRWVRFAARTALAKIGAWDELAPLLSGPDSPLRTQSWLTINYTFDPAAVQALVKLASHQDSTVRALAAEALGRAAYLPAPWEGHWWGTQPVKNPAPLNSVEWTGTALATPALITLLADQETPVRLAAATAFALSSPDSSSARSTLPDPLPALRSRLIAESDPAVRRQLVQTLGTRKDPQALAVFSAIALDEKADPGFRETAIAAVANIGGDGAKKTITQVASTNLSPAATLRVVQAVGEMKAAEAAPSLLRYLESPDVNLRLAVVKTYGSLGSRAGAWEPLTAALADKDSSVVNAALEALAPLHEPKALPAILQYAKKNRMRREIASALASTPDPEAAPLLVEALRDQNSSVRRSALGALKKMRAQSWPLIETAMSSGRIPAEFQPEIKAVFESGFIASWKVLGPFENVWGAVHPPESDALAAGGLPDLNKKYVTAEGRTVGWRDVNSGPERGEVDLGKLLQTTGMVCAYAYAEINSAAEADAQLVCGADDQIAVWLNGRKVHDRAEANGFNPDRDQVSIHFSAGANRLLVKIGNKERDWLFAARIPGLDGSKFTPAAAPVPEAKLREFALAAGGDGTWSHAGDPAKGEKLFHDPNARLGGICATCHVVRGKGGPVGPDLSAVAVNYKRPDLITSILEPSKTIALGFEQVAVTTKAGDAYVGAVRQETKESVTVLGADAQPHVVKIGDIQARTPIPVSIMPPGLALALRPEDFVDLLAYLESLRGQ